MAIVVAVHILQGLPGAGKSTFVRRQFGAIPTTVCSADHFLIDEDGLYRVSPERLKTAHARCLRAFVDALQAGAPKQIVVDNTNLTVAEMAPYVALGQAYGAEVRIWRLVVPFDVCRGRQTHPIPDGVFIRMQRDQESFSPAPWWPEQLTIQLATPASMKRAYLGLSLHPTAELSRAREALCSELDLLPRTEFHITVAFLGEVTPSQSEALADALGPYVEDGLAEVQFAGTGAAYVPARAPPVAVQHNRLQDARDHARVAWWSVASSSAKPFQPFTLTGAHARSRGITRKWSKKWSKRKGRAHLMEAVARFPWDFGADRGSELGL